MHLLAQSSPSIPWAALLPVLVVEFALVAYCLVDLARHPDARHLPRWAWALICLFGSVLGSVAYLLAGRSKDR